jgi:hypothetical protein
MAMLCIITTQPAKPPAQVILVIPGFVKTPILSLRLTVKMVFLLIVRLHPAEGLAPIVLLTTPLTELKTPADKVLVPKVGVALEVDRVVVVLRGQTALVLEERPQVVRTAPVRSAAQETTGLAALLVQLVAALVVTM